MNTAIINGLVIDPANDIEQAADLFISDGRIVAVGAAPDGFVADQTLNAEGQWIIPGLVDLSAKLGEPGFEKKADIDSETRAAVAAGITTLCVPPDTQPVIDSPADIRFIQRRQRESGCARLEVIGALTLGLKGSQLSEMASLQQAGAVAVSNVRHDIANANVLRRALEYAASLGLTVVYHPEIPGLVNNGCAHEGAVSTRLGLAGIPEAAETSAIGLILPLVEQSGVKLHFARVSTATGMNMIRRARHDGMKVSADVCAHQLFLTEMDIADFNSLCHTRPPLRSLRDRDALRQALTSKGIQAICSDHQPHENDAKLAPFSATEPGISALETLLPLTLRLVEDGVLSRSEAIHLVTHGPADILGIAAGTLSVGARADVCVLDPNSHWEYRREDMQSRGKNSPFHGWSFNTRVSHTFVGGRLVHGELE